MSEFKETVGELFNLQGNKFFRTIRGLTIAPGDTIRAFAGGDRKSFMHPFTYAITLIGISLFLSSFINQKPSSFIEEYSSTQQEIIQKYENKNDLNEFQKSKIKFNKFFISFTDTLLSKSVYTNVVKYSEYCLFFIISLLHLLVYKNLKFGFKKNVWYSFYFLGHIQLISILTIPFYLIFSETYNPIAFFGFLITLVFSAWMAGSYYEISFIRGLKKNVFIYLILTLNLILFSIVGAIFSVIYFF